MVRSKSNYRRITILTTVLVVLVSASQFMYASWRSGALSNKPQSMPRNGVGQMDILASPWLPPSDRAQGKAPAYLGRAVLLVRNDYGNGPVTIRLYAPADPTHVHSTHTIQALGELVLSNNSSPSGVVIDGNWQIQVTFPSGAASAIRTVRSVAFFNGTRFETAASTIWQGTLVGA